MSATSDRQERGGDADMVVIYDGECPFCSSFTRLMALRQAVGRCELVDARSGDPRVRAVQREGVDLNAGMAVLFGGETYHGSDAVALISSLSTRDTVGQRLLSRLLRDPKRAARLYPVLKFGRRITLALLARKPIPAPADPARPI
jgi:predicted DCC family thiol-disulfide oxidoreductase YuxK